MASGSVDGSFRDSNKPSPPAPRSNNFFTSGQTATVKVLLAPPLVAKGAEHSSKEEAQSLEVEFDCFARGTKQQLAQQLATRTSGRSHLRPKQLSITQLDSHISGATVLSLPAGHLNIPRFLRRVTSAPSSARLRVKHNIMMVAAICAICARPYASRVPDRTTQWTTTGGVPASDMIAPVAVEAVLPLDAGWRRTDLGKQWPLGHLARWMMKVLIELSGPDTLA